MDTIDLFLLLTGVLILFSAVGYGLAALVIRALLALITGGKG